MVLTHHAATMALHSLAVAGALPNPSLLAVPTVKVDLAVTSTEMATVDTLAVEEVAQTLVQETDNGVTASTFQDPPMLDSSASSSALRTTR
jgi:hypothetical protein